ncbi:SPFH domain-containing protein [Inhella gelatinilytica]|nr:SPFH domain-containing protein [Inhella gelatinilytica]
MNDTTAPLSTDAQALNAARRERVWGALGQAAQTLLPPLRRAWVPAAALLALAGAAHWAASQIHSVPAGQVLVRQGLGGTQVLREGRVWIVPAVHEARWLPARDLLLQRDAKRPVQTVEGLAVGLEVQLRVQLDPQRYPQLARELPEAFERELVQPALDAVLLPVVAQRTVRELFSSQRREIEQAVLLQLRQRLAQDGLILKGLSFGALTLPEDYRRGMESLLAEGLAAEKMRYTLELREKQVKEGALEAQAEREKREIAAEASAREQVIAARAQEEAMKHVLPYKQRQIEQRQLEAEAERQARVRLAEGAAQARQIEAEGEAKARQKLADAEAYRVSEIGKVQAEQMAREGALISKHPLLIQKTLADKLGDKVRVIVAPPGTKGQLLSGVTGGEGQE